MCNHLCLLCSKSHLTVTEYTLLYNQNLHSQKSFYFWAWQVCILSYLPVSQYFILLRWVCADVGEFPLFLASNLNYLSPFFWARISHQIDPFACNKRYFFCLIAVVFISKYSYWFWSVIPYRMSNICYVEVGLARRVSISDEGRDSLILREVPN